MGLAGHFKHSLINHKNPWYDSTRCCLVLRIGSYYITKISQFRDGMLRSYQTLEGVTTH